MTDHIEQVTEQLEGKNPEIVAETLRSLVRDNMTAEASEVFRYCNRVQPKNYYLVVRYAEILIDAGELIEAETLLDGELQKEKERYTLLYLLGRIDEKRGQCLNALDLYRRASRLAETPEEKEEINKALDRIRGYIHSDIFFNNGLYMIKLEGNLRPLNLQYNLAQLKRRREILKALLDNICPRAKSVLEVEIDGGVITRNLAAHGLKANGTAAEMEEIVLAIGFEYVEAMRNPHVSSPGYYRLDFDQAAAEGLEKKDIILVLPSRRQWYEQRSPREAASLLATLFSKCNRQLFFYIPPAPGGESGGNLHKELLALLKSNEHINKQVKVKPKPCFIAEDGGRLYRLDRGRLGAAGRAPVLPRGLEAVGGSSEIIAVDVERCRSLNGFGFTENGWNHFTAALKEQLENPDLPYNKSVLKAFYENFQPCNRQEQLFGYRQDPLPPLDRGWTLLPWVETKNRHTNPIGSPFTRDKANHHYGPNSDQFGRLVQKKLLDTYTLIKKHGYMPEIFPDGYIQGYLLKDGEDYRFYVNEGQHRMAAIGLLGYEVIKARFNPEFLPLVDIRDLHQWPQVESGLYSKKTAEKVFRFFFEEDGRRRAEELGLL